MMRKSSSLKFFPYEAHGLVKPDICDQSAGFLATTSMVFTPSPPSPCPVTKFDAHHYICLSQRRRPAIADIIKTKPKARRAGREHLLPSSGLRLRVRIGVEPRFPKVGPELRKVAPHVRPGPGHGHDRNWYPRRPVSGRLGCSNLGTLRHAFKPLDVGCSSPCLFIVLIRAHPLTFSVLVARAIPVELAASFRHVAFQIIF